MAVEEELESMKLSVPLALYQKLTAYVKACDNEISGFFDVVFDKEEKTFRVTKIHELLKQDVGAGGVEIDEEGIGKFNAELMKDGVEQLPRGWWHSHNEMNTFLSPTDDTALEKLDNGSYIVALVLNKDNDIFAAVQLYDPVVIRIKLDVTIAYDDEKVLAEAEKEVADKVSEKDDSYSSGYHGKDDRDPRYHLSKLGLSEEDKPEIITPFPRKKRKILKLIRDLGLMRRWDRKLDMLIYEAPTSGKLYVDHMNLIEYEEWQAALEEGYDPNALQ